jgi:hypothetical protein
MLSNLFNGTGNPRDRLNGPRACVWVLILMILVFIVVSAGVTVYLASRFLAR